MQQETQPQNQEKGISIGDCIEKAQVLIDRNGLCLFLVDIKESKNLSVQSRQDVYKAFSTVLQEIETQDAAYLPAHQAIAGIRTDQGFYRIGDAAIAGINHTQVITDTAESLRLGLPDVAFHYNVAIDGFDDEAIRTIR